MRSESVIELAPVDQRRQPDQIVRRIDDRLQGASEQIIGRGFGLLRTHRDLARWWGFSQVDHDRAAVGIP